MTDDLAVHVFPPLARDGDYEFNVTLTGPNGRPHQINVGPDEVLSYRRFQKRLLRATGALLLVRCCEGLPAAKANAEWKSYLGQRIRRDDPAQPAGDGATVSTEGSDKEVQ